MSLNLIFDFLIISIITSLAINMVARNFSKNSNILIDLPDKSRKFHKRATPLTGGISILISVLITGKLYIDFNGLSGYVPSFTQNLIYCSAVLVALFLVDDIKGLKPFLRLIIQTLLSVWMIYSTNVYISNLGNLFGMGDIILGIWGIPFTVFCAVGIMNAFNMLDGINGLASGTAMVALLFIGFTSGLIFDSMLVLMIGSMIGFLIFNLRFVGKKRAVFLGDHGSNMIGFWVAWAAIFSSQSSIYQIMPITTVWFVAIPLLDCIGLIVSRKARGISWSTPGRDHIHHKLMNKYSPDGALGVIIIACVSLGAVAVIAERLWDARISFALFVLFAFVYYFYAYYYEKVKLKFGI